MTSLREITTCPGRNVSPGSINPDNIQANPQYEDFSLTAFDEYAVENNNTSEDDIVAAINYQVPFSA